MDKKVQKEIVDQVVSQISLNVQPGSAFWRLNQIFSEELKKDSELKVFNDEFADGIAKHRDKLLQSRDKWILIVYLSGALLATLVAGYTLPINFPYIGLPTLQNSGLLEIVLVAFLVAEANIARYGSRVSLYATLLRTYVEIRYPGDLPARDLVVLRWGIEDVVNRLDSEQSRNYVRKEEPGKIRRILGFSYVASLLLLIIAAVMLTVLGVVGVLLHPSFGWLTYLVVIAVSIYTIELVTKSLIAEQQKPYILKD